MHVLTTTRPLPTGEPLSEPDQLAYLHLWRYLGHLLGLRGEWNPCTPPPGVAPIAYAKVRSH